MTVDTLYDVESYPNFFCCVMKNVGVPGFGVYEISARRNDAVALAACVRQLERMVGFNNIGYDYHLIHALVHGVESGMYNGMDGEAIAAELYQITCAIIHADFNDKPMIWERDRITPQLDLFLIHHFNNKARQTGLKALQFAMRSPSIEDLPIPPGTWLTPEQMTTTTDYCVHDVGETERFYEHTRPAIEFREELGPQYLNASDASIGKMFFRERLEAHTPDITKGRTYRDAIPLSSVILPYVQFRHEPFNRRLNEWKDSSVHASNLKAGVDGLGVIIHRGMSFHFGSGGLHASVKRKGYRSDAEHLLIDIDVTSYYPTLAIANNIYPAHLGPMFCQIYAELFTERSKYAKGTASNGLYKLALNAVFGDSNNRHSKGFYDPAYTLAITINGQLLICVLAEALMDLPGVDLIQANTDGITIRAHRSQIEAVEAICRWWEAGTALKLERADYESMFIRDVNNYIAKPVGKSGTKRKGAYEYKLDWHKDFSGLVIPKAAEAAMVFDEDPTEFITDHLERDPWDFMLRAKVPRNCRLEYGTEQMQRISRYYISTSGAPLTKIMPPLSAGKDERRIAIQKNHPVQVVNRFDGRPPKDIDLSWYIKETEKLLIAAG